MFLELSSEFGAWLVRLDENSEPIGRAVIGPDGFDGFEAIFTPPDGPPVDLGFSDDLDDCVSAIQDAEADRLAGK
jgi:hypothetical protein